MTPLYAAIYERLLLNAALGTRVTGGFHWGNAPADTVMPYVVLRPQGSFGVDENTSATFSEVRRLRCETYGNTGMLAVAEIQAFLERCLLAEPWEVFPTGRVLHVTKGADSLEQDPDRDDSGQEVWQGINDFEFLVQRKPGE